MGIRQWNLPRLQTDTVGDLMIQTGLPELLCRIFCARGIAGAAQVKRFLGEDARLDDPFLIKDMDKAAQRIRQALEEGERIAVYGDYDCDGITSTALLVSYLQSVGADVIYYVPDREKEGYGLNQGAVDTLHGQKVNLIVTVDNGVSAHKEVLYAGELGIDVVITDHHTPRDTLPEAVAVVNPHRADCPSTYKDLAGVGVAFKLICALEGDSGEELLEYYSDLVAMGTIADVVPLTGENRIIVRHGLQHMQESERPGISALLAVSGLEGKQLTSEMAAFGAIPRINASGRMGVADDAIELLLTDDPGYAKDVAESINEQNVKRKSIEDGILQEIDGILAENPQILRERVLIISGKNWHHGVVGIVSAKLVERYGKPCILFSVEGGEARGSGRSVKGFSLIEAIAACSEKLLRFGGHAMAAGLTLAEKDLDSFAGQLQSYASEHYEVMPTASCDADCVLKPEELTVEQMSLLDRLEPFGAGNESPLFCLEGMQVEGIYPTSDKKHIRIRFRYGNSSFYAVYFRMREDCFPYQTGDRLDVMAKISVGEYNGKAQLSVKIQDLRLQNVPQEQILLEKEHYDCYRRGEYGIQVLAEIIPSREDMALVYRYLRKSGGYPYGADALYLRLMNSGISYIHLLLALDVLEEMGFIRKEGDNGLAAYSVVADAPRADLNDSQILCNLKTKALVNKGE